jgi:4-amino-4-deoxy-L-arabinose transferase-like glycosyltransferase
MLTGAAFLLAAGLFFARLGELPLIDPDEGRNAEVAREMAASRAWLVPTFNEVPYLDKPALYFNAVALSLAVFGPTEAAARVPSALSGAALVGVMFAFCRRAYGERTAALAVVVLATTPLVVGFARLVIFDLPLALFTAVAILAGYLAEEPPGAARRPWLLLGAASSAIATLIKGPVGFLVPGLVLGVFHLADRRPAALRRLLGPTNLLLFLAMVLPWLAALVRAEPDFLHYGLVEETLRRYVTPALRRTEPVYYYAPVLLLASYPWSALLPEAAVAAWRARARWTRADRLFVVWATVVVLFFSGSQSKRPGYVLPAVIALAVLTARLFDHALTHPDGRAARLALRGTLGVALFSAAAAGVLSVNLFEPRRLQALLQFESDEFDRLQPGLGTIVLSLLGLTAAALAVRLRRDVRFTLPVFVLPSVLFLTVGFGVAERYADASSARRLARALPAPPAGTVVACLECFSVGLPFYLGRPVVYITQNGHGLTSNYVRYALRRGRRWPTVLVHLDDRDRWLADQARPVYLLARPHTRALLDDIAAPRGLAVREVRPGWWGALVPPAGRP